MASGAAAAAVENAPIGPVHLGNLLAGSVFDLVPATPYEFRPVLSDPDGGGAEQTVTAVTRAEPPVTSLANVRHVPGGTTVPPGPRRDPDDPLPPVNGGMGGASSDAGASCAVRAAASSSRASSRIEARVGAPGRFDRITFDPAIMVGRACIRGMRIPVSVKSAASSASTPAGEAS